MPEQPKEPHPSSEPDGLAAMMERLSKPVRRVTGSFHVCATCVRMDYSAWSELKPFLRERLMEVATEQDFDAAFNSLGSRCVEADESLPGHKLVAVPIAYQHTPRHDPQTHSLLQKIDPKLASSVIRFDDRRPLDPEIALEIHGARYKDFVDAEAWTAEVHAQRNAPLFAGPRREGGTASAPESRLALACRVPFKAFHRRYNGEDVLVIVESGLATMQALVLNAERKVFAFEQEAGEDTVQVKERLLLHMLDFYLAMRAEVSVVQAIDARWKGDMPCLAEILPEVVSDARERARIEGDIRVLYHQLEETRGVPGLSSKLPALFARLEALRYSRLDGAPPQKDLRQRFAVLARAIADEFDWVRVARVDWRPLKKAAGVETRGKKNAT